MDEARGLSRRRFLRQAALAGAGVVAAPLLAAPPAEAFSLVSKPNSNDQKKIGEKATQDILRKYREVTDGRAAHFNSIGQRLVSALPQAERDRWDFHFHVLDDKEANAFALPGGHMFLFTGLYSKMETDDAVAAVTGHEMTHVRKEHWAKAYAKQQERQLGLSILLWGLKANRNWQNVAGLADNIITMKFSRGEEDEADAGGLQNMVDADFNPDGMVQLFRTLQKLSGNGGAFGVDWMSDHPMTKDRIKRTEDRIASLKRRNSFPAATPLRYQSLY
jgi:predicted Zn-dependent protease